MDFDDYYVAKDKVMKIYLNGDVMTKPIELKIQKGLTLHKIAAILEAKTDARNFACMRLFNQEGVELFDDDLQYLKDASVAYASRGEDFDANSTFSEYNLVKVLGEGGFGQVLLGIHKMTQEKSAIKIVKTNVIGTAQDIDMVFREAEILKSLNHKNIVKIKNCFTLSDMKVVFVMEYLEGGELLARIEKVDYFSESQAKIYFKQIVEAMNYCHKNKLIHRDLKLENLLLVSTTSDDIKVVDFGIAGVASKQSVENIDAGSLRYMAPEVLGGKTKSLTPAIDVWAMGVILYMMVVGDFPFTGANNSEISEKIQAGQYSIPRDVQKRISADCQDAIRATLKVDPTQRISTVDLMNHPFISEENITVKFMEQEERASMTKLDSLDISTPETTDTSKSISAFSDKQAKSPSTQLNSPLGSVSSASSKDSNNTPKRSSIFSSAGKSPMAQGRQITQKSGGNNTPQAKTTTDSPKVQTSMPRSSFSGALLQSNSRFKK